MQFMLLMIPTLYQHASPEFEPDPKELAEMGRFNASLEQAGVLRAVHGLAPPAAGARIAFDGNAPSVTHGPFAGTTETVGGYWILDVASQQDAIDWARQCPAAPGDVIEVRRIAG